MSSTFGILPDGSVTQSNGRIFSPVALPCGRIVPNRLVKVALYEHLADIFGGPPNADHIALYSRWSQHGWGMIITGNAQVSPGHLSLGRDVAIPETISEETLQPFRKLAQAIHRVGNGTAVPLAIVQLSHGGRQSPNVLGGRSLFNPPLAPSAIALGMNKKIEGIVSSFVQKLLFQTPQEMSRKDIDDVVTSFVRGAKLAALAGFDGVQLHAAHGYLIAQFMSPKTNHRTDEYAHDGLKFLYRIVASIREVVPKDFILGIKLNASDYVDVSMASDFPAGKQSPHQDTPSEKEEQEIRALEHIRTLANWHVIDFIEVSGGDYENPEFLAPSTLSKSPRQAFYARFSRRALEVLNSSHEGPAPLILLTGGLRTPSHLRAALASQHANLLGIGRGSITSPDLPDILRKMEHAEDGQVDETYTPFTPEPELFSYSKLSGWLLSFTSGVKLVGAGSSMAWYVVMMRRLATSPKEQSVKMDYHMGAVGAIIRMWIRDEWLMTYTIATCVFVLLISTIQMII